MCNYSLCINTFSDYYLRINTYIFIKPAFGNLIEILKKLSNYLSVYLYTLANSKLCSLGDIFNNQNQL